MKFFPSRDLAIKPSSLVLGVLLGLGVSSYAVSQSQSEDKANFASYLYAEASDATRAEMLDLLDREDPAVGIFAHSVSMGLPIEELLEAAVRNDVDKGSQYYSAAGFLLPLLDFNEKQLFGEYALEDLDDSNSASEAIEKFFEKRSRLETRPDWHTGEYHMLSPVTELKKILDASSSASNNWYVVDEDSDKPSPSRPVFIQLFSDTDSIIVNDAEKINRVFSTSPEATLPVVFVYNTTYERPVSRMTQPATVKSIISDYYANGTMVTPPPEWDLREYHLMATMAELEDVFNLPEEDDIDPDRWQAIVADIKQNGIDESFLVTLIPGGSIGSTGTRSATGLDRGIEVLGEGAVINRLDKIAAAKTLGFTALPVSFYYIDNQRVKPFRLGLTGLAQVAVQAGMSPASLGYAGVGAPGISSVPGGNGGFGTPPPVVPIATPPVNTPPVRTPPPIIPDAPPCTSPPCSP